MLIVEEPREDEQWGNTKLESLEANEIEDGKRSVVVAVLDTGVNDLHEDLVARTSTAAASVDCVANDGVPNTADGAWRPTTQHARHARRRHDRRPPATARASPASRQVCQYASIKVVNDDGFIFPEYAICGFMWAAAKGVEVTNNSYYIDPWYFWCANDPDQGAVQESVRRVIAYTQKKGVINVAAAGNENYDLANKTTDSISPNDSTPITRPVNKKCLDMPTEHQGRDHGLGDPADRDEGVVLELRLGHHRRRRSRLSILSTIWPGDTVVRQSSPAPRWPRRTSPA